MDQSLDFQTHTMEEVWIKDEPIDIQYEEKLTDTLSSPVNERSGAFACDICGLNFKEKRYLRNHRSIHSTGMKYACDLCDMKFSQRYYLNFHRKKHDDGSYAKMINCDQCDAKFPTKQSLGVHQKSHGPHRPREPQQRKPRPRKPRTQTNKLSISHPDRETPPVTLDKNSSHMSTCVDGTKNVQVSLDNGQYFICDECGTSFSQESILTLHKLTHTSVQELYSCKICDKKFTYEIALKHHTSKGTVCGTKLEAMTIGKQPTCEICNMKFASKLALKHHTIDGTVCGTKLQSMITRKSDTIKQLAPKLKMYSNDVTKAFSCDVCGLKFKEKRYMKNHRRTHSDGLKYACDLCDMTFHQRYYLNFHRKKHDDGTFDKLIHCGECDAKFPNRKSLAMHRKSHEPQKSLLTKNKLSSHTERSTIDEHSSRFEGRTTSKSSAIGQPYSSFAGGSALADGTTFDDYENLSLSSINGAPEFGSQSLHRQSETNQQNIVYSDQMSESIVFTISEVESPSEITFVKSENLSDSHAQQLI